MNKHFLVEVKVQSESSVISEVGLLADKRNLKARLLELIEQCGSFTTTCHPVSHCHNQGQTLTKKLHDNNPYETCWLKTSPCESLEVTFYLFKVQEKMSFD